jgi:hypothetical protein
MGTLNLVGGGTWVYQGTSHGSAVLSVMAANTPGTMVGTAPLSDYWLVRTEDISGEYLLEEYNWIAGAEYADSAGADIISSSLAYRFFNNGSQSHTYAQTNGNTAPVTRAADIAAAKGIIVVTSAGNNAQEWSWPHIGFPADADSAMTVGAVDAHGAYAAFSAWGPTADGRLKPDVAARGVATFVAEPNGGLATANGTSFSVPLISGLIACLKQACPEKNNMEILEAVRQSASHAASPDTLTGYGVPDFSKAIQILTNINTISHDKYCLTIFPNPFHQSFSITLPFRETEEFTLEVSDISGRIIFEKTGLKGQVPPAIINEAISNLEKGLYFIKLVNNYDIYTAKAIKQ